MRRTFLLVCGSLLGSSLLLGCEPVWNAATSPSAPATLNLNGNWLISGDLPNFNTTYQEPPGQLNFAATLFVQNNQISGGSVFTANCTGLNGAQNFPIAGTVDGEGNFTAQVQSQQNVSLTFSGKAPTTQNGVWVGSYTYTNPGCAQSTVTKSFTSQALGSVSGTYTGSAFLGPQYDPQTGSQVSIAVQLQQGATAGSDDSNYGLTGSVTVTGSSCFHTGSVASADASSSNVNGNGFNLIFTMDDGSKFTWLGQFTDLAASTLSVSEARVAGGSCSNDSLSAFTLQQ